MYFEAVVPYNSLFKFEYDEVLICFFIDSSSL